MTSNLLAQKNEIKKRLIEQAGRLWGYTNLDDVDPLVRLLLDAFAYEVSKVGQVINLSNNKILEQLTSLLVPNDAMLAIPAHGVMVALPLGDNIQLTTNNQFYYPNGLKATSKGKIQGDIFFSPIQDTSLFDGHVAYTIHRDTLKSFDEFGNYNYEFKTQPKHELIDGEVWLGIQINDFDQNLTGLRLYFDIEDQDEINDILSFNSLIQASVYQASSNSNTEVKTQHLPDYADKNLFTRTESDRIVESIIDSYKNRFLDFIDEEEKVTISAEAACKLPAELQDSFYPSDVEELPNNLIWVKLKFPPIFTRSILEKTKFITNCIVVANIKRNEYRHNFSRSGRVLPIGMEAGEYFLSVESLEDNKGNAYVPFTDNDKLISKEGTYKLYYGNLGGSNREQGLLTLERLIYNIREEGDSFSSLGIDTIATELTDIYERLDQIEKKIERKRKGNDLRENHYVLANPPEDSHSAVMFYWTVNAEFANFIPEGTELQQYRNTNLIKPGGLRLLTRTIGGRKMVQEQAMTHYLRHVTLSKERLISTSDIRFFVLQELHHLIDEVNISDGVDIAKDPKKGLVRCTDITLYPKPEVKLNEQEWQILIQGLSNQISRKAMPSMYHRIKLNK